MFGDKIFEEVNMPGVVGGNPVCLVSLKEEAETAGLHNVSWLTEGVTGGLLSASQGERPRRTPTLPIP